MNMTLHSEFILLGFYEWPHLQSTLFVIFLLAYLMALTGNITIIVVITTSPNLHVPMYFFLFNLSILDIMLTSTIMPKLLNICLTEHQSIAFQGCFGQMFFFMVCVATEYFLLAAMAYDRYVAICCPLRYSILIDLQVCLQLALTSWGFGFLESVTVTWLFTSCSFSKSNVINHLYCDLESLLKLSSSGTQEAQMAVLVSGIVCGFIPLTFILVTYFFVICNILRIRSNKGKRKAFSTCSSHLTVISLFIGIILRMYVRPKSSYSVQEDKILSLLYSCCIPMLNPLIYSLRNRDVYQAIQKLKSSIHGLIVT